MCKFYKFYALRLYLPYFVVLVACSLTDTIYDRSQVGMEYWARWAHKALWHDSLWNMHEVSV